MRLLADKKFLEHVYYGYLISIFMVVLDQVVRPSINFITYIEDNAGLLIFRFTIFPFVWSFLILLIVVLIIGVREDNKKKK